MDEILIGGLTFASVKIYAPFQLEPHLRPKYSVCFDCPEKKIRIGEHVLERAERSKLFWADSTQQPIINSLGDYETLVKAYQIARARAMSPDLLFKDVQGDVKLRPYEVKGIGMRFALVAVTVDEYKMLKNAREIIR